MTLSIIIPCFNEALTINTIVNKVITQCNQLHFEYEIIIVNDGSTDNTISKLASLLHQFSQIQIYTHSENKGKGAAIKTAIQYCKGEVVVIQDADLEYDPKEYAKMLAPIQEGHADVVYGSRFLGIGPRRVLFYFHTIGNKLLTAFSNLFTQLNMTDMETCYKMFRKEIIKDLQFKEKGFGFEPEFTAKISKIKDIRIYEVGISYYGRTYIEGKKITWKDGFRTIYCIIKYNLFR